MTLNLTHTYAEAGTYTIRSTDETGAHGQTTFVAIDPDVGIDTLAPDQVGTGTNWELTLTGRGFTGRTQVGFFSWFGEDRADATTWSFTPTSDTEATAMIQPTNAFTFVEAALLDDGSGSWIGRSPISLKAVDPA